MSKRQLIMLLGALIIIISLFFRLPSLWDKIMQVIIGVLIIVIAYTTRPAQVQIKKTESVPYVDTHSISSSTTFTPNEKLSTTPDSNTIVPRES